jgi:phage internal scaffolding protein
MSEQQIRSAYRPHKRVTIKTGDGLAKQAFKSECDINTIMQKYEKTGLIAHVNSHGGDYGNYLNVTDYHTAMTQITEAQEAFMSLPAKLRERFGNNPANFLAFAQDEKNLSEMVEMGLAEAPVTEPKEKAPEKPSEAPPEPESKEPGSPKVPADT